MDKKTVVGKTAKGLREASGKTSLLTRDTRELLKHIDGKASIGDLLRTLGDWSEAELKQAVMLLVQEDFVRELMLDSAPSVASPPPSQPPPRAKPPATAAGAAGEELDFTAFVAPVDTGAEQRAREADEERARQLAAQLARQRAEAQARQQAAEQAMREAEAKAQREAAEKAQREAQEKAKREAEAKARHEAEEMAKREAEAKAQQDAAEKAKREAEDKAKREAEAKAQREAAEKAQREAEENAKREAEEKARRDAEDKARHEAEARARREAEEKAKREADEKVRREADEKARREAEEQARREAEEKAKREADEKARREAEEQARREAEEKARYEAEVAERRAADERERREAEERFRREAEEKARREAADRAHREEIERLARESAERERREAEQKARREAEERARREAEERAERAAEDLARQQEAEYVQQEAESRVRREAEAEAAAEAAAYASVVTEAEPPKPPIKWGKVAVLALVALLIVAIGAIQFSSFDGRIGQLEKMAAAQFQQPVKIRALRLSLFPQPHWQVEGLAIGEEGQIRAPRVKLITSLGSMFGDMKAFDSIHVESPVVKEEGLGWLLFGKAHGGELKLGRIRVVDAKLESSSVALPPLSASVEVGDDGNWRKMSGESADGKLAVEVQAAGGALEVSVKAASLSALFPSAPAIEDIAATGTASRSGITFKEYKARVATGNLSGKARLGWVAGPSLDGDLTAGQVDAAQLFAGLMESGRLEGKASFSLPLAEGKSPRLEGEFAVDKGVLAGVDLGRMLQTGTAGGQTQFTRLAGSVGMQGGRTQLRALRLDAGKLTASGSADVDENRNVRGQLVVELNLGGERRRAGVALSGPARPPYKGIEWSRR